MYNIKIEEIRETEISKIWESSGATSSNLTLRCSKLKTHSTVCNNRNQSENLVKNLLFLLNNYLYLT